MGNKSKKELILFTLPALIMVSITIYLPFVISSYYSLTEWNGISKSAKFIGLQNFKTLFFNNSQFLNVLIFTGKYTFLFMLLSNVMALILATFLVQKIKTANILRGVFFVPYIMSMIIVGFIWKFIFSQGFARLFEITGWGFLNLSWLGNAHLAFYAVVFVGVWQQLGFYIVLYIAGLQAIPEDVMEAATVDGAGALSRFFRVKLPLLGPSITICLFMSLTNGLKVFDIILALTQGGPGGATYSATLDIYREAFQYNNYGLGSAKALVFFLIVLIMTQIVLTISRRNEVEV
ncbi:carbohydrate ABC transporter permease [Halanaerobium salsuginis]|jgi:raffinose/stachyose/melibiose transport system permease protein|uniref:Raffinose/stachyose/melibiose transport system permease protein n=1 Tax=Halanaerobium salsuginis TaxID=29563 RepID=A0A1I4IGF9_9FIRM|nr:sugar ABC transporter permease [Halanaerobium salsuginis]SFL53398.1 raffinose/stachyose/melibiose transport system permease protein [Halanaerobium salsuginis]